MPASTGDPISAALSHSLATSSKLSSEGDNLDTKLIGSAKRVLLTEIKYEQTSTFNKSLEDLKSKYIVLKPTVNAENGEIKLKNGLLKPDSYLSDSKLLQTPLVFKASSSVVKPSNTGGATKAVLPSPKRVLFEPENIQLGWQTKTVPVGSGMVNLGNTCYLNSTLQALFHVPAFVNWLLNDKAHKDKCEALNGLTHTECLICAMLKTLKISLENSASSNAIRPHLVYNKLKLICKRLIHGHQEDAHEFLRYLIESMDRSYLRIMQANNLDSYSKETTPLSQIFGGYLRTEVRCLECRNISLTFQHFQDLLLDIRQATTLDEALEAYFTCERLGDGDEAYKCEKCHRRVAATKKFTVEKPPNVLCIQLKRFGITGGKNSKHIKVQTSLDLTKFWVHHQSQPGARLNYRLVSLVSHIGPSSNCGHYTAIGLSSTGQFYLFDDSVVRQVSSHAVSGNNTYIIMYELTSPNPSLNSMPSKALPPNGNCTVTKPSQNTSTVVSSGSNGLRCPTSPITNGTSSHSHSQPTTPLKTVLGSPVKTANSNTKNGPHKSLVPYSTESSDSESELATSKQKASVAQPTSSPVKNGFAIDNSSFVKFSNCSIGSSPNKTCTKSDKECKSEKVVNGWHVTEVVEKRSSNCLYNPPQNWDVIHVDSAAKSTEKNGESSQSKVEASYNGVNGRETYRKPVENGHCAISNGDEPKKITNGNGVVENGRIPNGKSWDGSRNHSTVDYLKKNSHQSYGGNVTTWNGGRTQIDKEAEMDRLQQRKRSYDQMYDEQLDHGKVKKVKNNHYQKNDREINGRRNYFQEHQNYKNNGWYKDRNHFYRTYSNNHYRMYQNNNRHSNYHCRR